MTDRREPRRVLDIKLRVFTALPVMFWKWHVCAAIYRPTFKALSGFRSACVQKSQYPGHSPCQGSSQAYFSWFLCMLIHAIFCGHVCVSNTQACFGGETWPLFQPCLQKASRAILKDGCDFLPAINCWHTTTNLDHAAVLCMQCACCSADTSCSGGVIMCSLPARCLVVDTACKVFP